MASKLTSEALDENNRIEEWLQKYKAAMVLSGVGDAIGYYRGKWEMEFVGNKIHKEVAKMGGIKKITPSAPKWIVSDDTVLHMATAEAIVEYEGGLEGDVSGVPSEKLLQGLARHMKEGMKDMAGRAPGNTTMIATGKLKPNTPKGYVTPYNDRGGGCGAAMKSMCIGMYYPKEGQLKALVCLCVELGRMTHNHPTGFLGSLASALFASYALQGKPTESWGKGLLESLPLALEYVEGVGRDVTQIKQHWSYFERAWVSYLRQRGISDGLSAPSFPHDDDVDKRDAFYKSLSHSGWGGASGHDAPMIAYDALLGCHGDWEELASRAFFHGGDNDTTGTIAACWFGLMHGYKGVPEDNYKKLEYRERLENLGESLHSIVFATLK